MIDTPLARGGVADELMHSFCSQWHIPWLAVASEIVRMMRLLGKRVVLSLLFTPLTGYEYADASNVGQTPLVSEVHDSKSGHLS
jgi:hypothetical protein